MRLAFILEKDDDYGRGTFFPPGMGRCSRTRDFFSWGTDDYMDEGLFFFSEDEVSLWRTKRYKEGGRYRGMKKGEEGKERERR